MNLPRPISNLLHLFDPAPVPAQAVTASIQQVLAVVRPQIDAEESCRLDSYLDTAKPPKWTIGWGRADSGVVRGMTCTQPQADLWRDQKLMELCDDLEFHIPWWRTLGAVRAAVLLQMAYQMGVAGLLAFKNTLACAGNGDFAGAAANMLDSDWAKETPARAEREAEQMRTGVVA